MFDPVEVLIASPVHLLAGLVMMTVIAFRARAPWRRWRWPLLSLTLWAWVTTTPVVAHALALDLEREYPPVPAGALAENPETVIVVLASGAGFNPAINDPYQLGLASFRRVVAGADIWRRTGGTLITTGSVWPLRFTPVAERMANLAVALGVDAAAVRALPDSRNTYENLDRLDRDGLRGRPVFLVTSAVHMPRAMAVAHKLGLDVIPVPCDYRGNPNLGWRAWLPDNNAWPLFQQVLHERIGLLYYRLRGWA